MLLFVDPVGVLRGMSPFLPSSGHLPAEMEYWLNIYRGRSTDE